MSLDVDFLATKMLAATEKNVETDWPVTRKYFELEIEIFAEGLIRLTTLHAAGTLSEEEAKKYVARQKHAWKTVLLSVVCLSLPVIERALDAALNAVKWLINPAVGFELL